MPSASGIKWSKRRRERQVSGLSASALYGIITRREAKSLMCDGLCPPTWARFVMRCYSCRAVLDFFDVIPESESPLGQKKCKKCGKPQPFADAGRRRYDPRCVVPVEEEAASAILKATQEESKRATALS